MPLYEYQCRACGKLFEVLQKIHDAPLKKCPQCGGRVDKRFSSPAIQFKGSGWYITDYAKKSTPAPGGNEGQGGNGDKRSPVKEKPAAASPPKSKD